MVSHIEGCVEHALREDAAGIFSKSSREQPARTLKVVAQENLKPAAKKLRSTQKAK
jgi:hypothetical protein